jgi:hypothetical protein
MPMSTDDLKRKKATGGTEEAPGGTEAAERTGEASKAKEGTKKAARKPTKATLPSDGLLIVRVGFRSADHGFYPPGTVVQVDDPAVKGREHLFESLATRVRAR